MTYPRVRVARSVRVAGRLRKVRVEAAIWMALAEISARECLCLEDLCTVVAQSRHPQTTLDAAIRIFAMTYKVASARASSARTKAT